MNVTYSNNRLEKECCDEKTMQRKYSGIIRKLKLRIQALYTYSTVGELAASDVSGHWHLLHGNKKNETRKWAGEVSGNYRIIIQLESSGSEMACTTVKVIEIKDYH